MVLAVCIVLFLFCCGKLYQVRKEYSEGTETYEKLDTRFITALPQITEPQETDLEECHAIQETAPIKVDFDGLIAENSDVVAWLYCPDTLINYPVMQAENNEKYLRTLPDGTWNIAGTLFMDYRNAADFSDSNSIVYGHNMKNDSMFGILPDYNTQEFYEAHPYWYLLTPNTDYKVELIAGYVTPSTSDAYAIPRTQEEKESLIQTTLSSSAFITNVEIDTTDKLLTLSTCSYEYSNARFVLVGVLRELAKQNND